MLEKKPFQSFAVWFARSPADPHQSRMPARGASSHAAFCGEGPSSGDVRQRPTRAPSKPSSASPRPLEFELRHVGVGPLHLVWALVEADRIQATNNVLLDRVDAPLDAMEDCLDTINEPFDEKEDAIQERKAALLAASRLLVAVRHLAGSGYLTAALC